MEAILTYTIIFILSVFAIAINVYAAVVEGNITHLKNNRKPEAGVSLMGYIVFPMFFMGIAYLGNMFFYGLGWCISFGLFLIFFIFIVFLK